MDEKIIEEIVQKVFEKAKKEHASHSRFALSKHISEHSDLSSKTLERAYDRHVTKRKKHGAPHAESVKLFCKYLDYLDYADYVSKNHNQGSEGYGDWEQENNEEESIGKNRWIAIALAIIVGAILSIIFIQGKWKQEIPLNPEPKNCMAWADTLYIATSCDKGPYSVKGTDVVPYRDYDFKNFKKVTVDAAYTFFAEDGKPLIWYHKNKNEEIEYFTAPGLHPTTGKTLKEITRYIVQKYVPVHSNNDDSFIN